MKIILFILLGYLLFATSLFAQSKNDSLRTLLPVASTDSINTVLSTPAISSKKYNDVLKRVLGNNKFINLSPASVYLLNQQKSTRSKEILFYMLSAILLIFGIFKIFYSKYFYNVFQVFFNTSLRQNQLTDMLLQAKLPSLIFNIFFVISAGLYAWALLNDYSLLKSQNKYLVLYGCVASLGAIYLGKFFCLKFLGWISDVQEQSDTYIFITFLINKILGVVLLPFTIIIMFGSIELANAAIIISLFCICLLFLYRYFRSYSLLQNNLKFSWFQFVIYIVAAEIIPLLVLYKLVVGFWFDY